MIRRVLVRADRCIGCRSCEIACVNYHLDESNDPHSRPMAVPRIKVGCGPSERSRSQVGDLEDVCSRANLRQVFVVLCQHCDGPECVGACTAGALTKDPDGAVRHHPELCTGCLECIAVCPFSAIYDNKAGNNVVKCDLCGGKGIPSCIEACMVDALYLE